MPSDSPAPPATRDTLIHVLTEIALLMELKGENPFKIRAYRSGADTVANFDGDILAKARANDLTGIKGIGTALRDKLHDLATSPDGTLPFHQDLRAEFPETLFELFDLQGIGPKKIKLLYDTLGIDSLDALQAACEDNRVAALPGFAKKSQEKILHSIAQKDLYSQRHRLGTVSPLAETLLETLRDHPAVSQAAIAGSYRRGKETLHDLDLIVATTDPVEVIAYFVQLPSVTEIIAQGETKAAVRFSIGQPGKESSLQCDLRAVTNAQFPFALQYFTGSKEHNVHLRSLAQKKNLSLNEYGLSPTVDGQEDPTPTIQTEDELYHHLGLVPVHPALREDRGEIEAAQKNQLPKLVQLTDLRGTFHNHTTASDGKNTLAEMAAAASELGLSYLGIADHSKSSVQANGLHEDRLLAQVEQIYQLNKQFEKDGDSFRLLAGSEVDILKDGSLDFDDSVLAQLDYAVASVHSSFTLPEAEMTARVIRAMENPHIHMIGHLTGRLLLKREPYAINHQKIIDCAAETGTVIELNANPARLDMDWRWWKRAAEAGVLCAINPDAHHTTQLQYLHYGVRQAQKGWLTKANILNTRSLEDVLAFLKK